MALTPPLATPPRPDRIHPMIKFFLSLDPELVARIAIFIGGLS